MHISVRASEVSACIGRNKFKPASEVLDSLLKRHGLTHVKTKEDKAQDIISTLPAAQAAYQRVLESRPTSSSGVQVVYEAAVKEVEKMDLKADEKLKLMDHFRGSAYTSHGIRKENTTALQTKLNLVEDHAMYRLPLCKLGNNVYTLCGKIDRIETTLDGKKILVEIKNRTKTLFHKVYQEEMIQVQTYLQMLDMEDAKLIEQYNSEINTMPITRDRRFWEEEILPGLIQFCEAAQVRFLAEAA